MFILKLTISFALIILGMILALGRYLSLPVVLKFMPYTKIEYLPWVGVPLFIIGFIIMFKLAMRRPPPRWR